MKQLFLLLSTIYLLSSCSSEDYSQIDNDDNELKYAVTVNAQLPKFAVEASPLRVAAVADGQPDYYSMVVYTDDGQVYDNWYYFVEHDFLSSVQYAPNKFTYDGKQASTSLYLPVGMYHIAFFVHFKDSKSLTPYFFSSTTVENYGTDIFGTMYLEEPSYPTKHNGNIYFNTLDFQVVASESNQNANIELQPMWSYIDISINDAQTFEVPEGTNALQFEINPIYYGFEVKSKLAPFKDEDPIITSLDSIRANATFNLRTTVSETAAENNTIQAKIHYLKLDSDTTVLDTRELTIPQAMLENGQIYNISGKLGSLSSGQSMNITLGEFNKEDVVIEF